MTITGKQYLPSDNSYQINLSTGQNDHIANFLNELSRICLVLTEPFKVKVNSSDGLDFIIVKALDDDSTHMVLYHPHRIILDEEYLIRLNYIDTSHDYYL